MNITIKHYDELTKDELYEILSVRVQVFVAEQKCAYCEVDYRDQSAFHIFSRDDNGKIVAYLRVVDKGMGYEDVMIGHILSLNRLQGYASRLLEEGVKVAKEKFNAERVVAEVQTYVKNIFEKQGFKKHSPIYYIDDIQYLLMCKEYDE